MDNASSNALGGRGGKMRRTPEMKRIFTALLVAAALTTPAYALDNCVESMKLFKSVPETQPFLNEAYGYAVFPTVGKGGIGIGGGYGKGCVYAGGAETGQVHMGQLSIGFQLGGQAFSQLIIFKNKDVYDSFVSGTFEFGADASAVAITAGAQASAGTKGASAGAGGTPSNTNSGGASWYRGVAVFTVTKGGLMYEAVLAGQTFKFYPLGSES